MQNTRILLHNLPHDPNYRSERKQIGKLLRGLLKAYGLEYADFCMIVSEYVPEENRYKGMEIKSLNQKTFENVLFGNPRSSIGLVKHIIRQFGYHTVEDFLNGAPAQIEETNNNQKNIFLP